LRFGEGLKSPSPYINCRGLADRYPRKATPMEIGEKIIIEKGATFTAPERGDYQVYTILSGKVRARFVTPNKIYVEIIKLERGYLLPFLISPRLDKGDTICLEHWADDKWQPYRGFTVTAITFLPPCLSQLDFYIPFD
jgi:hypothetical protein